MNRIYKVIWNKARNCYMAVAEFVKRQGKSSSGLNRRHIGAALGSKTAATLLTGQTVVAALLAAVAICAAPAGALANSGGTLQANGDYIGVAPEYNVTIDENVNGSAYGRYETDNPASGAMLSISTGGKANAAFGGLAVDGAASGNKVTISSGTVNDDVYGGYSSAGNAEENAVTVSGKSNAGFVVGGYSEAGGFAKSNRVIIHNMTEGYQVASATGGVADTGRVENNSVTVEGAAITYDIDGGIGYGEAIHNQVTLAKGEARGLLGGSGNVLVSQNTATLNEGGKTTYIYGGYAGSGIATKNEVIINGGTVDNQGVMEDAVYGGNAFNGDATYNKVTLNGGAINADVYGGHVWEPTSTGKATDNTVVLDTGATGKTFNSNLYGGKTNGSGDDISGNSLQVKGKGIAVTSINNFENYNFVLPADSKAGDTMLKLTGQGAGLTIDGSTVGVSLAKGTLADIGLKLDESVTLLEKTGGNGTFTVDNTYLAVHEKPLDDVAGGLPVDIYRVTASEDTLNVTYTEHYLYGDGGTNTTGQRETGNTLTITSGKATAGFGGRASSGDVTKNNVEMSGGELVYDTLYADIQGSLYGGLTDKGNANHNTVTVSGGKLKERVYGGASYDGNTENNTVTIKGGTVGTHVYGGRTYGGGNAVNNTVTIEGGTVGKRVYGGRSDGGNAVNNTVTIKGGTVGERVYGGYAYGAATGNAVNLTGTTHGLDGAKLYGYNNSATSHSGNELHIGGAKTYDENGEAVITKGSWQGMDGSGKRTNRVDTVSNFDSIALHHVVWGDVPAISANEITNIGGLDVTGLEFFTHPDNSTVHEHAYKDYMVLVHADTNDLTGLKISYLDEGNVKTETLTNQGIHYHTAPHSSTENGVTVDGTEKKRIYLADHNKSVDFCFHVTGDKLTVGEVDFVKNGTARILDGRFDVRNAVIDTEGLTFTAASKLQMAAGDAMTLVDAEDAIAAKNGATLQPFTAKQIANAYNFTPAEGVTVAATLSGSLRATPKNSGLVYKVNSNQADRLTFGSVDWKDSGALFKRPAAVTFAGAAVDTSEIHFKNLKDLKGNAQMTLVSDFGGNPGRITGTTYKIGTTLEGEGAASLVNGDLIFTTKAQEKMRVQDQTHNTVMGMMAGLAALAGGTEQLSQGMESLNDGDGSGGQEEAESGGMIIASIGGNKMHQETGSHVTSNTWNGVLGIGGKRAVKSGTWQYAAFAEHGRANFTLHSDAGRGDGTSKYTGGGLLAKWQSRHDVYVEGSIRVGRMHDTASDMLYDAATGQSYGYDVHANYIGGHVGLGKVFRYNNGRSLDVYGKYFHMKRDGVSFEAEGHYDLDSVTSSVLRVGARYGATDKKWNWYGGLAYEYEFDGKATGRADGAEIRAASIKGGSVRGELGLRMEATKTSPWKADIRLTGYAGKRRGIGGNVSVAYTF